MRRRSSSTAATSSSDEPYAEWAYAERDRLRGLTTQCLRLLATILAKRDDIDGAAGVLEQLAELEPYDAEVHRSSSPPGCGSGGGPRPRAATRRSA